MTTTPTPAAILRARKRARLTQTEAAALVQATLRTWQYWERPPEGEPHPMPAAKWELFKIKTANGRKR